MCHTMIGVISVPLGGHDYTPVFAWLADGPYLQTLLKSLRRGM